MVLFTKSMEKALSVIHYTILWSIIGIIIIYVGFNFYKDTKNLIFGVLITFIGIILISLGFLASFIKVNTELILEELKNENTKSKECKQKEENIKPLEILNLDVTYKKSEEKYSIIWDIIIVISIIISIITIVLFY